MVEIADGLVSISFGWFSFLPLLWGLRCFWNTRIFVPLFHGSGSCRGCEISFSLCVSSFCEVIELLTSSVVNSPFSQCHESTSHSTCPEFLYWRHSKNWRNRLCQQPPTSSMAFHLSRQFLVPGVIPALAESRGEQ